ncbi:DNA cytosine methyltransferase [Faucicola atlantae]|uniref:DNA cytosine methyltransferase n=1 Tax=Faucicola atlantae TaxID=34059 RepID=UPI0020A32DD0|nr:DNA cytosine methyltransferase [Moraxella atlantae]
MHYKQLTLFDNTSSSSMADSKTSHTTLKAIDLFAGVGGIRLGFQQVFKEKLTFVFASELEN